jgi:hypothetical protein
MVEGTKLLQQGDEICVTFDDASRQVERATVCRVLTDQQEGMGPEVEDYVARWLEISMGDCVDVQGRRTLIFGTDSQYSIDGRKVAIRKV